MKNPADFCYNTIKETSGSCFAMTGPFPRESFFKVRPMILETRLLAPLVSHLSFFQSIDRQSSLSDPVAPSSSPGLLFVFRKSGQKWTFPPFQAPPSISHFKNRRPIPIIQPTFFEDLSVPGF